jgi:hypothetical protein
MRASSSQELQRVYRYARHGTLGCGEMRTTWSDAKVTPGGAFQAIASVSLLLGSIVSLVGLGIVFAQPKVFLLGLALLTPWLLHRRASAARKDVFVETTPTRLVVAGRTFDVDRIAGAWTREPQTLVLVLDDRTLIELALRNATASDVLAALGWDPARRTLRAVLRGAFGAFTQGFLTFVFGMWPATALWQHVLGVGWNGLLAALATCAVVSALVVRLFARPRLVIGGDGIRIEGGLGGRFIPYADIARVLASAHGADEASNAIVLTLRTGKSVVLPTVAQEHEQVAALVRRIEAGRAAVETQGAGLARVLDRNGRSLDAWRAELAALGARQGGFRDAPVSADLLERELRDATAPAERRVAAAVALKALDPDDRRVRVVVDTSADEDVRAALEAACEDRLDEDVLARVARRP